MVTSITVESQLPTWDDVLALASNEAATENCLFNGHSDARWPLTTKLERSAQELGLDFTHSFLIAAFFALRSATIDRGRDPTDVLGLCCAPC